MNIYGKPIHGEIDTTKIEAILFDVDGTLSNTDDRLVDRIASVLAPVSWLFKDRNPKKFTRRLVMAVETPGNFLYHLADRFGIDAHFAKYYKLLTAKGLIKKISKEKYWIIPGVREMLLSLYDHYPLGVVSARDAGSTREFLDFFELTQFFQVIVTAQTCHHTKPFPDPIFYAAKSLEVNPENCLMVGDTIVDIQSGKSAGTQTVGVLCGFGTAKELKRVGADMILSSTKLIGEILFVNSPKDSHQ